MTNIKKIVISISILVLLLIGWWTVYYIVQQNTHTATLDIEATPLSSNIKINGENANHGINKVVPGSKTIIISLSGFDTFTTKIDTSNKETKYIGVILKPNNSATTNWYSIHQEDQSLAEKISSKYFDDQSQKEVTAEPFIKELPYISAGFEFKIDYGAPATGSNKPVILIQADTQTARDDAIIWIKSHGYDPSTMNIEYTTSK